MNKIFSSTKDKELINLIVRTYAFKTDLKIKWVRPEKIPCYKPAKSGDLGRMHDIDKSQYLPEFRNSKELETANEYVKRLFTLKFHPNKHTQRVYLKENTEKVKRHEYDSNTIEVKLARWTGYIRAWQELMEQYPHDVRLKVKLKELIDKRKKHLKYLRKWDYKKFEWILDRLDLVYKPPPSEFRWVTRKESLVKLTNKYCDDLKNQRLDALRLKFENEQPAFLEEKIRSLEFIKDEQKECNAPITVAQEEIDQAKKQLEELKLRNIQTEEY